MAHINLDEPENRTTHVDKIVFGDESLAALVPFFKDRYTALRYYADRVAAEYPSGAPFEQCVACEIKPAERTVVADWRAMIQDYSVRSVGKLAFFYAPWILLSFALRIIPFPNRASDALTITIRTHLPVCRGCKIRTRVLLLLAVIVSVGFALLTVAGLIVTCMGLVGIIAEVVDARHVAFGDLTLGVGLTLGGLIVSFTSARWATRAPIHIVFPKTVARIGRRPFRMLHPWLIDI